MAPLDDAGKPPATLSQFFAQAEDDKVHASLKRQIKTHCAR